MHALAALLAGGLLGAVSIPGGQGDARVDADSATYDVASGTYRLEGAVAISRGEVRLRAGAARWDPRTRVVEASGGVLLSDATRVVSAERLRAVLDGELEAHGVVVLVKSGPTEGLAATRTLAEAASCGRNALTARAESLGGHRGGDLHLERAQVTPCDCGAGAPSWELRAGEALVHPGKTVELTWPVLWITPRFLFVDHPVPVFAVPWISLPLGERVSGLLAPQVGTSGPTGWMLAQPLFLTLGQTADTTVTPLYAFGRARSEVAAGKPSVRGPGGVVEGRWAPALEAGVRLQANVLWDLDDEVDPPDRAIPLHGANGARGLRLALSGGWAQRIATATTVRADLDLVGDPLYVRDFTPDMLLRDATARRSAVVVSSRQDSTVEEVSAAWLEPVASTGELAAVPSGLFGAKLPAFHRWPALDLRLLPVWLAGPVRVSGRVALARFAPPGGDTSDGGPDGVGPGERGLPPAQSPATEAGTDVANHTWEPGERLAATRLDGRVAVSAPFSLGGLVALEPSLSGAALGYLFDAARGPVANAWGAAGLTASTSLRRSFGEVRHELEPRVEWRATTGVAGAALPGFGYDGWDRGGPVPPEAAPEFRGPRLAAAAPPGLSSQLRLALATRLSRGDAELLWGEIGQEVDLRRGELAEAFLRAGAARGPVSGEADVRLWTAGRLVPLDPGQVPVKNSWLDAFSELRLRLALADGRGDELRAGLLAVAAGGSGRLGAGVDDLFDPRAFGAQALANATVAGRVRLGAATLGYDVSLPGRTSVVPACGGAEGTRLANAWELQQQTGSIEWDSPCRCFRARLAVRYNACGEVGGSVSLDLGRAAAVVGH